jgi:steroid 5-alpha reductase family enzyme
VVKEKIIINAHKVMAGPIILLFMIIFNRWNNPAAWTILSLHGTYGVLWVLKSYMYPDKLFENQPTPLRAIWEIIGLNAYWSFAFIIIYLDVDVPYWLIALTISTWGFGIFFHYVSDMQKFISLQLNPENLIHSSLWAKIRNPNYFGELLVYLSYAMLSMHWFGFTILILAIITEWYPRMRKKDNSLSRYPNFVEYKAKSKLFIPYLW